MTEGKSVNLHVPRLLVTGGTGFIGSHLAFQAQRQGMDVRATGRVANGVESERRNVLLAAGVPFEAGDLRNADLSRALLEGRDTVVHLAAAQHEAHMPAAYFRAVNVGATRLLLEAARECGVRRFVYGSTIGVYGNIRGTFDETSPVRPTNAYGRSKLEAEVLVRDYAAAFETCVVRISETYGPGDLRLLKLFRAIDRGHFVMLGDGRNRRRPMHVTDLARGLLLVAQHPAACGETFILGGSETLTTGELVAMVAAALHRDPPRLYLPLQPFVAAAIVLETVLRPFRIRAPLHRRRLDFFRVSFEPSTAKAQALLDFRTEIDLRAGIADTVRWYRAHGFLPPRLARELAATKSSS